MNSSPRDDRVLPVTRAVAAPILLVLVSAFAILYFWPSDTARLFAWTIRPDMTPLLMGAGYLGGGYTLFRTLRGARWHEVALAFPATAVFTLFMALATLLHWDRFNHAHIWFFIWLGVYFVSPFLLMVLWWMNRATDPRRFDPVAVMLPRLVRWTLGVAGVVELALAVFIFLAPDAIVAIWPWSLTPLTARVIAGWYTLPGVGFLSIALDGRWSAARVLVQSTLIATGLILIGVVRAWGDFDPANPLTWVYLVFVGIVFAALAALHVVMDSRRRA